MAAITAKDFDNLVDGLAEEDAKTIVKLFLKFPELAPAFIGISDCMVLLRREPWLYKPLAGAFATIGKQLRPEHGSGLQFISQYAVAIGFVDKVVEFLRKTMRSKGLKYLTEIPDQAIDAETECILVVNFLFASITYGGKDFALRLAQTGFLGDALEDIKHIKHMNAEELEQDIFETSMGMLQNCAKNPDVVPYLRELGAVQHIIPLLGKKNQDIRALSLLTLSFIVEDEELNVIQLDPEILQFYMERLMVGVCNGARMHPKLGAEEGLQGMSMFAKNASNRCLMVTMGISRVLLVTLEMGLTDERLQAMATFTELAKDPENMQIFKRDSRLRRDLKQLQAVQDEKVSKAAADLASLIKDAAAEDKPQTEIAAQFLAENASTLAIFDASEIEFLLRQLTLTSATEGPSQGQGHLTSAYALRVLADFAKVDSYKREIFARGGLSFLDSHMRDGTEEEKELAVEVLLELMTRPEYRDVLKSSERLTEAVQQLKLSGNTSVVVVAETTGMVLPDAASGEQAAKETENEKPADDEKSAGGEKSGETREDQQQETNTEGEKAEESSAGCGVDAAKQTES